MAPHSSKSPDHQQEKFMSQVTFDVSHYSLQHKVWYLRTKLRPGQGPDVLRSRRVPVPGAEEEWYLAARGSPLLCPVPLVLPVALRGRLRALVQREGQGYDEMGGGVQVSIYTLYSETSDKGHFERG